MHSFPQGNCFFELNSRLALDGRWYSHQIYQFDENAKKDDFFNAHCRPKGRMSNHENFPALH